VQLALNFPQLPLLLEAVWEQIPPEDRRAALEALAKLLAKTAMAEATEESRDE
jgi:hypothetical protein